MFALLVNWDAENVIINQKIPNLEILFPVVVNAANAINVAVIVVNAAIAVNAVPR